MFFINMANFKMKKFSISFLSLLHVLFSCAEKQIYIVHLGEHNNGVKTIQEIKEKHNSYLLSVKANAGDAKFSLLYSYKHATNGFAALLTPDEASKLSGMDGIVSVSRSHPGKYSLHTTRSWTFSGLQGPEDLNHLDKDNLWLKSRYGKDVIVGMIDSGIWPESKSFSDEGMGPIPKSWKGKCQTGPDFNSSHCNKKIIGARYYVKAYEATYGPLNRSIDSLSPRDVDGHGTHTSSTVAGRHVFNISAIGGFASGTASGGAPLARLAIYKVCWAMPGISKEFGNTCFEADILAAMDDAIADGVHVMSLSVGSTDVIPYKDDGIAIGALHAVRKNIVVVCSAGNDGPDPSSLANIAPWIITVAAASVDREFIAPVILGDGKTVKGQSVTPYKLKKNLYPLVYAAQVENPKLPLYESGQCLPGSLSPKKAKGKIVLCLQGYGTAVGEGAEVKRAGGIGFIAGSVNGYGDELLLDAHLLPSTSVTYRDAIEIIKYINTTKSPKAYIFPSKTELHRKPAPFIPSFSRRGPNALSPNILKPDIAAPGLNILAAWSEGSSPTDLNADKRRVKYNIVSGTSMSCPHVAAASALLKAIHPVWSSAAIRSAIITTAGLRNNEGKLITNSYGKPADPFQFGAGYFRPTKAADPGLVYDASCKDYLLFLCSNGGTKDIDNSFKCPKNPPSPSNLNYPSLAIPKLKGSVTVTRTVTNVGSGKSVYFASVKPPRGFTVKISPSLLSFKHVGEKKSFTITVKVNKDAVVNKKYAFGWYRWFDGIHNVRSPLAVSLA